MGSFEWLRDRGARYIDYSMAWKGALFLGVVVFLANASHGPLAALPAAAKQAAYTYFVAGFITRLCQTLAIRLQPRSFALAMAVLVPSCISVGLTYVVHSMRGTPEPIRSTIPTILTGPPAFLWWGRKGRDHEGERNEARMAAV